MLSPRFVPLGQFRIPLAAEILPPFFVRPCDGERT